MVLDWDFIYNRYVHQIITPDHEFEYDKSATLLLDFTNVLPISAIIIYLVLLQVLPKIVPEKGFRRQLKPLSALHNLFLAVLSFFILYYTAADVIKHTRVHGYFRMICDPDKILELTPSLMLYVTYLFCLSKFVELFDTIFLVLKDPKRPVNFLHWYHHVTVLLFTWYANYYRLSAGFHFQAVNAFVHTLMYSYYFIAEIGGRAILPPIIALFITTIQIVQMVFGIWVNYNWIKMWLNGEKCNCNSDILIAGCVAMYASYLFLFCKFFYNRYLRKSSPKAAGAGAGAAGKSAGKTKKDN